MRHPESEILTKIILAIFRTNGRLLEAGDELVKPLRLTSARWQVLGAVALAGTPLTVPQIAAAMGITRQGIQKQIDMLATEGLLVQRPNPSHKRSALYDLSKRGAQIYEKTDSLQTKWARQLAKGLSPDALLVTLHTLETMQRRLKPEAKGGNT
jgi:DNA-binding MarR family transcriptional regulator